MVDFFAAAQRVLSMIMSASEMGLVVWLVQGGIVYLIRGICFWIDTTFVSFIGYIYKYFMTLIEGNLFNEAVVNAVLKNIYLFIGIIVFFRIAMLVVRYLINPELLSDQKVGADKLIYRVIIGALGIILIPTIFDWAIKLQSSIIEDQVIQQIVFPADMLAQVKYNIEDGGAKIGTTVLAGFLNPNQNASQKTQEQYEHALIKGDLSSIDLNTGGFLNGYSGYEYGYFFIISTLTLGYVLFLMLQYCLDVVVRFFKLFLYQMLAPVAMVEYIVNGSEDGVFKNWKQACLSTYFMLFVRLLAVWFVVFVMTLMNNTFPKYSNGSLLVTKDYLLKALIVIGLLGFMKDLPKLIGQIFGLDLEQESSATGFLKSVGGIAKGLGMSALSAGGAALGGAFGAAKAIQKAGLQNTMQRRSALNKFRDENGGLSKKEAKQQMGMGFAGWHNVRKQATEKMQADPSLKRKDAKAQVISENSKLKEGRSSLKNMSKGAVASSGIETANSMVGAVKGMGSAAAQSTSVGGNIYKGFSGATRNASERKQKAEAKESKQQQARNSQLQEQMANDISTMVDNSMAWLGKSGSSAPSSGSSAPTGSPAPGTGSSTPTGSSAPSSGSSAPTGSPAPGTGPRTTPKS